MDKQETKEHNNRVVKRDTSHLKRYKMTVDFVMSFESDEPEEKIESLLGDLVDDEFNVMHHKLLDRLKERKINMHTATFRLRDEKDLNVIMRRYADGYGYL